MISSPFMPQFGNRWTFDPQVASHSDGGASVLWVRGQNDPIIGIISLALPARGVSPSGAPTTPEAVLGAADCCGFRIADLAAARSGSDEILVVWEASGLLRVGVAHRDDFILRDVADLVPRDPPVARAATGDDTLLAYRSGSHFSVRRFEAGAGGEALPIATQLSGAELDVVGTGSGGFAAVASGHGVVSLQTYDGKAAHLDPVTTVSADMDLLVRRPTVASLTDDRLVVVWTSGSSLGALGIRFRLHRTDGTPLSPPRALATSRPGSGIVAPADVTATPEGGFLAAWAIEVDGGWQVVGRRFGSLGRPIGSEFAVSDAQTYVRDISLGDHSGDSSLAVWSGFIEMNLDVYGAAIYSRDAVFVDGFESGDLTDWSRAVSP